MREEKIIYEVTSEKEIRLIGYVYCAGGSVTDNPNDIYRFIEFKRNSFIFSSFNSKNREEIDEMIREFESLSPQFIEDLTEEEAYAKAHKDILACPLTEITEDMLMGIYCDCI